MGLSIRNCQFAFRCDKTWNRMQVTSSETVRFCGSCQKEVHWCCTEAELAEAVALNRCVAIEVDDFLGTQVLLGSLVSE
jgi:hypothetical protein